MDLMRIEDEYSANVYTKRPALIVKGKGVILWDINGKEYIDCIGGHGVCNLGHPGHPKVIEAIKNQLDKLVTCPGTLYNDTRANFFKKLASITPGNLNKIFLSNSGAEAVECAIKLARKYTGKKEIIACKRGFHGRTFGSLSATWNPKYRNPFLPLVPGFKHVVFGNANEFEKTINKNTAAMIVEPIQGEGGIHLPPDGYLQELRDICSENNVLLIFDEIQTGFGRTGKIWACEHWNVIPDIICMSKSIAGGIPMGATASTPEIMGSFKSGQHGTTFGGNPLACAAGISVINTIKEENILDRVQENGEYFRKKLKEIGHKYRIVREIRGIGLMIAMEMRFESTEIIQAAVKKGLLLLPAGRNVIRFLPPLVIEKDQIDKVVLIMDELLEEHEKKWIK